MEVIIFQVDAFTDKAFRGNPAGVIPDARGLTEEDMKKIAMEMNLSETAFIFPRNKKSYDVKFYTPKCEVDLCGHATIAAFYTLAHKGYIEGIEDGIVEVVQNTKAGSLPVEIYFKDGQVDKVMMQQGEPKSIGPISCESDVLEALGLESSDIGLSWIDLRPEIITTGLPDLIVPVKDSNKLKKLTVDFEKIARVSNDLGVVGIHVFTMNNLAGEEIECRNFAPAVGINEESATGTANGALLYYLKKNNSLESNCIEVYQGEMLNRPSKINCCIVRDEDKDIIKVGGKAAIVLEGIMTL